MKERAPKTMTAEVARVIQAWVETMQRGTPRGREILEQNRRKQVEWKQGRPLA